MTETGVSAIVPVTMPATIHVSEGQSARTCRGRGEEHEGELARLRQEQRDAHRVVVVRPEQPRQPVEDRRLHDHDDRARRARSATSS